VVCEWCANGVLSPPGLGAGQTNAHNLWRPRSTRDKVGEHVAPACSDVVSDTSAGGSGQFGSTGRTVHTPCVGTHLGGAIPVLQVLEASKPH
jgi:hypothetical protein